MHLPNLQLGGTSAAPLAASECVAIEDSVWGLQSALAAGLKTVGITHTYDARSLVEAHMVIDALTALNIGSLGTLWPD